MNKKDEKALERELCKLRERVKRSKLGIWEKRQAYELISKTARLMNLED